MKGFPAHLIPANMNKFDQFKYNRKLCYIRRYVYETMLSPDFSCPENCGINFQQVPMGEFSAQYVIDPKITDQICSELQELGWETTVSYGGTMLFVYTLGNKPEQAVNCVGFE